MLDAGLLGAEHRAPQIRPKQQQQQQQQLSDAAPDVPLLRVASSASPSIGLLSRIISPPSPSALPIVDSSVSRCSASHSTPGTNSQV
ncbi:uncharacterized protein V6R79_024674 [Siganus canaliculatus]